MFLFFAYNQTQPRPQRMTTRKSTLKNIVSGCDVHSAHRIVILTLFIMGEGEEKRPLPYQCFSVTSTNVGISPQNLLTLSCDYTILRKKNNETVTLITDINLF